MKKILLLCLFIISGLGTIACLNEHHVNKQGRATGDYFEMSDLRFEKRHNKVQLEEFVGVLLNQKVLTAEDSLWNQNSIAVNYIKLGRLEEAEVILNKLLKRYPRDYVVIVNLGTLYELQGKNKQALEYIKKAIAINPESHMGSEWFHVKVL